MTFLFWPNSYHQLLFMMNPEYKQVGRLTEIFFYPVKSCRGIPIESGNCTASGLDFDRHWVILDRGGRVVALGSRNELALVVPTILDNTLKIEAPGMQPLVVPLHVTGGKVVDVYYCGLTSTGMHVSDQADAWFSKYLGKPHTFYAFNSSCKPRYIKDHKIFGNMPYIKDTDCSAFANDSSYLMTSEESLAALNKLLPSLNLDMQRFRPNIVINGCGEFSEDNWKQIKIGDVVFRCQKKCGRCRLPNVDPFTGERNKNEPYNTLQTHRLAPDNERDLYKNSPIFGRMLAVEKPGTVKKGDIVYAIM